MTSSQYSLEDSPESIKLNKAWGHVVEQLSTVIKAAWFARFIKPLKPVTIAENGKVVIQGPGKFCTDWVENFYGKRIEVMLGDELGQEVTVEFAAEPNEKKPANKAIVTVAAPESVPAAKASPTVTVVNEPKERFKPDPEYRFENFVVGQSNRLAHAGATAVASQLGVKYNPLFIYSQPGLGKTHLLHAIANEILRRNPEFPLVYTSAQEFAEEYIAALQTQRIDYFRKQQKATGLWLIDDIQFIAGKDKTQEEIFYSFNHLYSLGKQIVICSDRPPKDLYLMEERLRSRFEAGLVADIQLPDTETRSAIILKKAATMGMHLSPLQAMHLSERINGDVRVLKGMLAKLEVTASLDGRTIDDDMISDFAKEHLHENLEKVSLEQIVQIVGRHYKIPVDEILGTSRKAPIVTARHVSIYLLRELTGDSWKHIGAQFGDRDHTSMMHGYQKIAEQMQKEKDLRNAVQGLKDAVRPAKP